ncbi:MAG: hypothetical protein EA401_10935 [Planctomycetota bacterium]|nr:MAG: hypothetical protein EA401_10935 [Planctomycetota bacterium]
MSSFSNDMYFVFESLPDTEAEEAREFDKLNTLAKGQNQHCVAFHVDGKEDLRQKMSICGNYFPESDNPSDDDREAYVHISSHGCKKGLTLKDGSFLCWESLYYFLASLNEKCGGYTEDLALGLKWARLTLCLSSCNGIYASDFFSEQEEWPVNLIIAPDEKIKLSVAPKSFVEFYASLFRTGKGLPSLTVANQKHAALAKANLKTYYCPDLQKLTGVYHHNNPQRPGSK